MDFDEPDLAKRQHSALFPARVANHSPVFGLSYPLTERAI